MNAAMIQQTVELLRSINPNLDLNKAQDLAKAWTQSGSATTGITAYDLEAPSKKLYPVLTPLRNRIPRVSGKGGIQANWKAVTGVNTGMLSPGVSGGNRGGAIVSTTADYFAAYRGIGLEDYVTFEADYAAENFEDIKSIAVEGLLRSTMIAEENVILGGNTSVLLGTTPTPTMVASASGGTLATQTLSVICIALGYDAYWAVAGANNGFVGQSVNIASAVVPASISRTNTDGTVDVYGGGAARKSAAQTASITGPNGSCGATVPAVANAVGYAWYWATAGAEVLGAITTINSVSIIANAAGAQTAASMPATDQSTNALVFDGLLTQINKGSSGAYVKALATGTPGTGTALTADGAGGITEIDAAFAQFWNLYRLSPDTIFMNAQELLNVNKKIIAGGSAPLFRFNIDAEKKGVTTFDAGAVLGSYLNKITNYQVKIEIHPTMPPGTMAFYSSALPYPISNVGNVLQVRTRRDYYQIEWPVVKRRYEYGVYADEVLQCFAPFAFGVITNITNG
jgi:hypothetical protein